MTSLTLWRAGMKQKPWALESQLSHQITHRLESRNGTETMSLEIPAITWDHLLSDEQEWNRNHEPWSPSYHMRSLTDWRAGMEHKLWTLEFQLPHKITHKLESRNGTEIMSLGIPAITQDHSLPGEQTWDRNHESWNPSYHMRSLTDWSAGMEQRPWALEFQLSYEITYSLESRNGTETMSLGIPAITRSLTDWRVGMGQKLWALESQLSHKITHKLESRNRTETMSLGIPAITWDY